MECCEDLSVGPGCCEGTAYNVETYLCCPSEDNNVATTTTTEYGIGLGEGEETRTDLSPSWLDATTVNNVGLVLRRDATHTACCLLPIFDDRRERDRRQLVVEIEEKEEKEDESTTTKKKSTNIKDKESIGGIRGGGVSVRQQRRHQRDLGKKNKKSSGGGGGGGSDGEVPPEEDEPYYLYTYVGYNPETTVCCKGDGLYSGGEVVVETVDESGTEIIIQGNNCCGGPGTVYPTQVYNDLYQICCDGILYNLYQSNTGTLLANACCGEDAYNTDIIGCCGTSFYDLGSDVCCDDSGYGIIADVESGDDSCCYPTDEMSDAIPYDSTSETCCSSGTGSVLSGVDVECPPPSDDEASCVASYETACYQDDYLDGKNTEYQVVCAIHKQGDDDEHYHNKCLKQSEIDGTLPGYEVATGLVLASCGCCPTTLGDGTAQVKDYDKYQCDERAGS